MSEWFIAGKAEDLGPGERWVVEVDDVMIAIFNLDGSYYAMEDVCTHDGSEIASGCLVGDSIECPRHGARFNVKTGEVTAPPAYEPVDVFPVEVENGIIKVRDDRWD